MNLRFLLRCGLVAALALVALTGARAQEHAAGGEPQPEAPGTVRYHQKISATEGGFTGALDDADFFGFKTASIGDLDGDGIPELAVGAYGDDDGGAERGAVWVLFMNADGTVRAHQKISSTEGGFTGVLDDEDRFGTSVAALGDLDGDGVPDLAVGAYDDDDGGTDQGAVWVLFMNADGTVRAHQKISSTEGGFTGVLTDGDSFGFSAAALGDLDGDGVPELVVGAYGDDDGGSNRGAVWVLSLRADGTVRAHRKISSTEGHFTGVLDNGDSFGFSVAALGDLDGDGIPELAVGAYGDDDGGTNRGAVWVLFLNANGTVRAHQKISSTEGGFTGVLDNNVRFGVSVAALGDLDGDGRPDLAVGTDGDNGGGSNRGAVWVLFLDAVLPPLSVTATPTAGAPVPAEGGPLTFTVKVRNNTSSLVGFDLWVIAEHGTSNFSRRFSLLSGRVLGPYQTKTFVRTQNVPGNAPAGPYDVAVYAGRAPYDPVAVDHFAVTKLQSAAPAMQAFRGVADDDWDGTWVEVGDGEAVVAAAHGLARLTAAPNPFAGRTTLAFALPAAGPVRLAVYDVLGREVAVLLDEAREAGTHTVGFDAVGLPAGAYLVRLDAGGAVQTQRVTVVR